MAIDRSVGTKRILGIDPSLTCSGWALFSVERDAILAVGKLRSQKPSVALPDRLRHLQGSIDNLFADIELNDRDVVVCEAPTTMRDPRAAFKVEQVRGMFETLARQRGAHVPGRINPRSVQREVMGLTGHQVKRDQVKSIAAQVVRSLYEKSLVGLGFPLEIPELRRHQDVVDAILVASLARQRVCSAREAGIELSSLFESKTRRRTVGGWRS